MLTPLFEVKSVSSKRHSYYEKYYKMNLKFVFLTHHVSELFQFKRYFKKRLFRTVFKKYSAFLYLILLFLCTFLFFIELCNILQYETGEKLRLLINSGFSYFFVVLCFIKNQFCYFMSQNQHS